MKDFICWVVFICGFGSIIIGWIAILIHKIVCGKKKNCKNDKCKFRNWCSQTAMSDNEKAHLRKMLDDYEKKSRKEEIEVK